MSMTRQQQKKNKKKTITIKFENASTEGAIDMYYCIGQKTIGGDAKLEFKETIDPLKFSAKRTTKHGFCFHFYDQQGGREGGRVVKFEHRVNALDGENQIILVPG